MQGFKKIFSIAYLLFALVLAVAGFHVMLNEGLDLSWGGVLLITVPVLVVNGDVLLQCKRTGHRLLSLVTVLVLLGFIISVSSLLGGLAVGPWAFPAAVGGILAFALYRFWFVAAAENEKSPQPPAA